MIRNRIPMLVLFTTLALLLASAALAEEPTPTASEAFDQLKSLAGTWHGKGGEGEQTMKLVHEFRISANGSVVMETMSPGTEHEMINMYHLNGDELVLTHYCAGANQPTMRLDRSASKPNTMKFDFTGGTNFDPATDGHIHAAELVIVDENTLESNWTAYNAGQEAGTMQFTLKRDSGE